MKESKTTKTNDLQRALFDKITSWKRLDWILLILVFSLSIFGGLTIHSTEPLGRHYYSYQHWIFSLLGLGTILLVSRSRYQLLMQWHWFIYALTNILLVAVMFNGVAANGAQRWISIAGFNVQPSEFAKIAVAITLAALLHNQPKMDLKAVARTFAITSVPWGLVFFQPDLGTSLVFGAMFVVMLYWANVKTGWLMLMVSPLFSAILYHLYLPGWLFWIAAVTILVWLTLPKKTLASILALIINLGAVELGNFFWSLLKDYQKARLIMFLDPEQDPLGGGYHLIQSRIAIGSGGLWGQGWSQGPQTQLNFIPEQHTDFIFSVVGEEFGFIGCLILLIVFWLICVRLILIATKARDNFGSLLVIGILTIVAFQTIVNISMTVGLAPITGIPLPWMSYGRSAQLAGFICIALVESVASDRPQKK